MTSIFAIKAGQQQRITKGFFSWLMLQRAVNVSNQDMGVILPDLCIESGPAAPFCS